MPSARDNGRAVAVTPILMGVPKKEKLQVSNLTRCRGKVVVVTLLSGKRPRTDDSCGAFFIATRQRPSGLDLDVTQEAGYLLLSLTWPRAMRGFCF
jgi:hypothetical protein